MISKTMKNAMTIAAISISLGIGSLSVGQYLEIKELHSSIDTIQHNNAVLESSKKKLEGELKKANEVLNKFKTMEFRFNYPSGIELNNTVEIKQGDTGYYAQIDITGVKANAALATNFMVEGSTYSLNLSDFDLLARTVRAETGGMVEEANVATANVIFNRLSSENYPDTIFDVIHQPNQFEVVDVGTYLKQPTEKAIVATIKAMNGVEVVPNALGFWNANIVPKSNPLWQYPIMYQIGEHVYSRLDG